MMTRGLTRTGWLTFVLLLLTAQATQAGGFYMTEVGTPSSLGTAAAGNVTNNQGADASWTNPAGMAWIDDSIIFVGIQVLVPLVKFKSSVAEAGGSDGGNAGEVAAVPSFFWTKPISDKWAFGLSMTAPLGGAFDAGDDFVGRYAVTELALAALAGSSSFSYKINDSVSIGAGVSIIYTTFEMDIAIKQESLMMPAPDGKASIEDADDVGVQGYFGLQWKYSDGGTFGAVYRTKMNTKLEGDISISGLVVPVSPKSNVSFEWDNPQLLEIGIRQKLSDRWTIVANLDWEDWSNFANNVLTVDDTPAGKQVIAIDRKWKDTYKFGIGARRYKSGQYISFGVAYDTSPVDDEDRTLDLPSDEQLRLSFAVGRERSAKFDWALAGTALWLGDGKVDQIAQGSRVAGEFDENWIFFLGSTFRWVR